MTWQPDSGIDIARARASMTRRVRQYFDDHGVLEVMTPALSRETVTDPNINSIAVTLNDKRHYLHTSPEYMMKRLIAAGFPDIYQVCRVFRNAESGRRHQPEFTMIEWYRLGFDLDSIVEDAIKLITASFDSRTLERPRIVSYADVFEETLSIDPLSTSIAALIDITDADEPLQQSVGDNRDAWLDLAFATRIAPCFDDDRLTVVHHYPAGQASLARLCPQDAAVADRFEIYAGEVEVVNGFVELTNADEQLARFENDREVRSADGKPDVAVDYKLIEALRAGMPECAGAALGLDRLLMIAEGLDDIADVMTFTSGDHHAR